MPTPDEMTLIEVLELLTPTQKQSILVQARQLAKTNLTAVRGNKAAGPDHVNRKGQSAGQARPTLDNRPKLHSAATAPVPAGLNSQTNLKTSHARRLCGMCKKIVDPEHYVEHLKEKHGITSNSLPSTNTPMAPDRNKQDPDIAKGRGQSQKTPQKSAHSVTNCYVDGRVKGASTLAAGSVDPAKDIANSGKALKCAGCGRQIAEAEFENHWAKVHKNRNLAQHTKERSRKKKTPRLIQGGLCNPR